MLEAKELLTFAPSRIRFFRALAFRVAGARSEGALVESASGEFMSSIVLSMHISSDRNLRRCERRVHYSRLTKRLVR